MTDRPIVTIHADESCLGNQFKTRSNPGGAAGLVEFWDGGSWRRKDFWHSDPDTTNNKMAIQSGILGLTLLKRSCNVRFVSDSQYLVRGMNEWVPGWKARGWKRKSGPPDNLEHWKRLETVAREHRVTWVWVRGHAGDPRNEYVDNLAVQAAKDLSVSEGLVDSGFEEWLEAQREKKERYMDFFENLPPDEGKASG
jgi:ribonuclease HI